MSVDSGTAGYTDGFVVPVPSEKKADYQALAQRMAGKFKEYGAVRVLEAWGDDVPDGEVTDYRRAVQAQDGEEVVLFLVPTQPGREPGMRAGPRVMAEHPEQSTPMPFDGKRMFWAASAQSSTQRRSRNDGQILRVASSGMS